MFAFDHTLWPFLGCIIENDVAYDHFDIKWEEVEDEQACADLTASTNFCVYMCYIWSHHSGWNQVNTWSHLSQVAILSPHTCAKILLSLTVKDFQGINLDNILSENIM